MGIKKSINRIQNLLSNEGSDAAEQKRALIKIIEKLDHKEEALNKKLKEVKTKKEEKHILKKIHKCRSRKEKAEKLISGM